MAAACALETLVRNDGCTIAVCSDCGSVSLNLGVVSLHLASDQFERLGLAVRLGLSRLPQRSATGADDAMDAVH